MMRKGRGREIQANEITCRKTVGLGSQIAREKVMKVDGDEGGQISRVRAFGVWILVFMGGQWQLLKALK